MGNFICFEGLDGSGKSTVAKKVVEKLKELDFEVIYLDKKNCDFLDAYVNKHMKTIKSILWDYAPDEPLYKLGDYHWLLLNASWFAALENCILRPLLKKDSIVIMDNWYYKLVARFILKDGFDKTLIETSFRNLVRPDLTIFLDVDPEVAVSRRDSFSITETGNMDGLVGKSKDNFIIYQNKVRKVLNQMSEEVNWLKIDTNIKDENSVVGEAVSSIKKFSLQII
ncbi:dTMP kinase [Bacillus atrophaeus]|nr:dTMP kinase [Bacillus atrophaeus]MDQ0926457.1 dTMP kinase [Bacillus atrophaeus]